MSLFQLLIGRRKFLAGTASTALTLALGRIAGVFGLLAQTDSAKAQPLVNKKPKGIVVYYSATGNTAQVANAIYKGMKSVIACDVAPMTKMNPADMAKYDVVAIGSPNWYMRVPANVLTFTHDMPRMNNRHCVLFATHGSGGPGMFWIMSRNMLKKGMTIIGWSDWYGTDILTPHDCLPDGEWGHPDSIDLAEAEAFGRQMAENSIRISSGETNLLPDEIPSPAIGGDSLFSPAGQGGKLGFAGGAANGIPRWELAKCVYPRCTQCMANCPVNAIDLSLLATAGAASPLVRKEACMQCGGLCERVCNYDAIAYIGDRGKRVFQKIDMKKCTYPKCTACMDHCPQNCIDVSKNPPVINNRCENESLCFGVCPVNAITFTPTSMHIDEGQPQGMGPLAGGPGGAGGPGAGGPGGAAPMPGGMGGGSKPRFRSLNNHVCLKARWPI